MHPNLRKPVFRVGAAALGDFILVMRELQVDPAPMNVEGGAEQFVAHGAAFDMPAGAAPAPGAVPARRFGVGRFPQHEIHRVAFERGDVHPRACDHVINAAARKLPVSGITPHVEQHMGLRHIGMAARNQVFDHRHHRADILGRARLGRGPQRRQCIHIRMIPADGFFGPLVDQLFQRAGCASVTPPQRLGVDLVIHVGEIAHIGDVIRPVDVAQQAEQRVEHHHGAGIAQMGAVIDGGAADVHPHICRVDRGEGFLRPCCRIVQPDGRHRPVPLTHTVPWGLCRAAW